MKKLLFLTLTLFLTMTLSAVSPYRVKLDKGWRTSYKVKLTPELAAPDFDDSRWLKVDLPHDWSIHFNPDSAANTGNDGGYLPGVRAAYRYTLSMDTLLPGKYVVYVEGAYMNPVVLVNGEEVDSHTYGYTSFRVDVTEYLQKGDNLIAITVDNSRQKNSRWYSGTGLYRPVWLEHYNTVHIMPGSMFVTTPGIRPGMAIGRMEAMAIDSDNERAVDVNLTATLDVTAPDGTLLEPVVEPVTIRVGEYGAPILIDFPIPDPMLWSPDTPCLYKATLTLADAAGEVAREDVTFGLRTFDFDAEEGAFLNDNPIILNGACVHHDNGMLGAAAYDAAERYRVMQLKRAGFNAVRTSHNPPSTAFLDACDELGLLVIDEAFDGWRQNKNPHDYGEVFNTDWPVDLEAMIKRDRNHPSIIAWSIGNEILERKSPEAVEIAGRMADLCRSLDPTRPVTQALASWDEDWEIYDPLAAKHDIVGYNYLMDKMEGDHLRVPDRVMWQTESYPRDVFKSYIKTHELPYLIGDFVWTGMDYIGESGIGRHYYEGEVPGEHYHRNLWPWHNAVCGDINFIGQRKPISLYRDMLYNNRDTVVIAVREPDGYRGKIVETQWGTYPTSFSWNWAGHENKPIEVEVMSRYPKIVLQLNDSIAGSKKCDASTGYKALFTLPYKPGKLVATAYNEKGQKVAVDSIITAGPTEALRVDYERIQAKGEDYDLLFITVNGVDKDGVENDADDDTLLNFRVSTGCEVLGTANANPTDPIGYTNSNRQLYRGKAGAVIKAPRNMSPTLTITSATLAPSITILNGVKTGSK